MALARLQLLLRPATKVISTALIQSFANFGALALGVLSWFNNVDHLTKVDRVFANSI